MTAEVSWSLQYEQRRRCRVMILCTRIISNSSFSRFVSGYPRAMILFRTSYFSRSSVERLFNWAHGESNMVRLLVIDSRLREAETPVKRPKKCFKESCRYL